MDDDSDDSDSSSSHSSSSYSSSSGGTGNSVVSANSSPTHNIGKLGMADDISRRSLRSIDDTESLEASAIHSGEDLFFSLSLPGVTVSIVDNDPKELLLLSILGIDANFEKRCNIHRSLISTDLYIRLEVNHIQIDNMQDKSFPTIFGPSKMFSKKEESKAASPNNKSSNKQLDDPDLAPLIQLQISRTDHKEAKIVFEKYNLIQIQVGELQAFADIEIILPLCDYAKSLVSLFKNKGKLILNNLVSY